MDDLIPEGAKRGLGIFAHPDDESLWCGGLIARADVEWTIVCCSIPPRDPVRAYKFFLACETLGAKGRLLPFPEESFIVDDRTMYVDFSDFDFVLTHGAAGEYGHAHHIALHDLIRERVPVVRFIGYGGKGRFTVPLDETLRAKKLAALKCYDHVSVSDGTLKWQALLDYYGKRFDLWTETYD